MNQKGKTIVQKLLAIFFMPVLIYALMAIVDGANGVSFNMFEPNAFKSIFRNSAYMSIIALGIGFQLKYGRFDFSGGAIITVSGITAALIAAETKCPLVVYVLIAVVISVALSVLHSLIYITVKVPISVISLATAFLLESMTGIILGTNTVSLVNKSAYNGLWSSLLIAVPLLIAIVINFVFSRFTIWGRQGTLLAKNQQSAVNIGINEKKNVIISYVISGLIFGLAAAIFGVKDELKSLSTPLESAGTLFGNIIPSLVALFLSRFIDDDIGTFVGAITIQILYFGLRNIGLERGSQQIAYSFFLAAFIFISGFWDQIILYFKTLLLRKAKKKVKTTQ